VLTTATIHPPALRRSGLTVALAALALMASACVSSTPPPADVDPVALPAVSTQPAVPTEPVTEEVVAAVEDYWEARDAAFAAGPEAGLAFVVAQNHPLLPYGVDECREAWFDGEIPPGFAERSAVLSGSIVSDPEWTMVTGPLAGRDLGDGLFEMVAAFSYEGTIQRVADRVAYVHLQVDGDDVRHFLLCEDAEIIVAAPAAGTGDTTGGTTGGTAGGTTGGTAGGATGGTTGGTTSPTPIATDPTVLPPITATPSPVTPPGGGGGTPTPTPTPNPPGTRPPGSGIDFCDSGDPGAQPVAGDYYLCPDDDIDNTQGEDGGTSEPTTPPSFDQ
jgi:hypothetical protein